MKKALYLDADDTIWDVIPDGIASECPPPYERIGDVLLGRDCAIILKEGVRELIEEAHREGMDVVLVSQNKPEPVEEAVKALDLHFDREYVSMNMKKFRVIERDMKEHGIKKAYFVDDIYAWLPVPKSLRNRLKVYDSIEKLMKEIF